MKTRERQQQMPQHSDSVQVTNHFQSRPFSVPANQVKAVPYKQKIPDLQAQYERAKRFGHNIANISLSAHNPPPAHPPRWSLIQPKLDRHDMISVNATQPSHPLVQRATEGRTEHGEKRYEEVKEGDTHRQVGDPNTVVQKGRHFKDSETGYDVYVNGNRVVIIVPETGKVHTQFRNNRANTQKRIRSRKWIPQ